MEYICICFPARAPFNRTIVELKLRNTYTCCNHVLTFNRTIVELKYLRGKARTARKVTFNRTIVELKWAYLS